MKFDFLIIFASILHYFRKKIIFYYLQRSSITILYSSIIFIYENN